MADTLLVRQEPSADEPEEQVARRDAPAPSAAPSAAQEENPWTAAAGPLSGEWEARLVGEDAPPGRGFTLTFEMSDDGRARGHVLSEYADGPMRDVVYDASTGLLTFARDSEIMRRIKYRATVEGDTMKGTLSVEDEFVLPFEAKRTASGDVAALETPAGGSPQ